MHLTRQAGALFGNSLVLQLALCTLQLIEELLVLAAGDLGLAQRITENCGQHKCRPIK